MSFKKGHLYPCNPATTRGVATKLSSHGSKIVYTNGRTVIIRDIDDPTKVISYSGHPHQTTVARISPTGSYCASGDVRGNVRVWDILGTDQVLKSEVAVFGGRRINDLAWDGESKRIIAVGDGNEAFGRVFMTDTGSSAGEISGHSKVINAVSIRHQRPFRAATASDDNAVVFYHGAPYKYEKTIKAHTRFVQDVKYAPSGDLFASVGSDYKLVLYDGKEGTVISGGEIENAHKGSIMACSWSPDSKFIVTSSADCTVKLWDVETKKATTTWTVETSSSKLDNQQVGNTWAKDDDIVSLSLGGDITIFDRRSPGDKGPSRVLYGPTKSITSTVATSDGTLFAGAYDGRVTVFSTSHEIVSVKGEGFKEQVSALHLDEETGVIHSVAFGGGIKEIDTKSQSFSSKAANTVPQPAGLASIGSAIFAIAPNSTGSDKGVIDALESGKSKAKLPVKYTPSAIDASSSSKVVAVGGDDKLYLYSWDGQLKQAGQPTPYKGTVSALAFSPDGKLLAAGYSGGNVILYSVGADSLQKASDRDLWTFHSAKINSLAWTKDGKHCASGSLDTNVYIWSIDNPSKNIAIKGANPGGVSSVSWVGEKTVASGGADGCVRTWEVTFHA